MHISDMYGKHVEWQSVREDNEWFGCGWGGWWGLCWWGITTIILVNKNDLMWIIIVA